MVDLSSSQTVSLPEGTIIYPYSYGPKYQL